jgi:hypothetical protein
MRIEQIKQERLADRNRLSAQVVWEQSEQPVREVYFEASGEFGDAMAYSAEAFVSAALSPALWAGEQRILVEGELCPEFLDNITVVTKVFQNWFPQISQNLVVEAKRRTSSVQTAEGRAAFFFTGGVDSLASLRSNRLNFSRSHPASVKDGIIVFNLEVEDPKAFGYALNALSLIAEDADVVIMPVSTNLRVLNEDWKFWWTAHMGPALGGVGHAFSRRIASVIIASDYDVPNIRPHGSHPLVDPYFSSFDLKIRYDGIALSRLEKLRLLAGWQVGLDNVRVCNRQEQYQPGKLNCGECEKCFRTMLGLVALGALSKTSAFPHRDVTPDLVERRIGIWPTVLPFYEEIAPALAAAGRNDLARVVERTLTIARGEAGWRGRFLKFDRDHLNGGLRALKKAILPNGKV